MTMQTLPFVSVEQWRDIYREIAIRFAREGLSAVGGRNASEGYAAHMVDEEARMLAKKKQP